MQLNSVITGKFEIFAVASGKSMSEAMSFDAAWAEMERRSTASGFDNIGNGMDIRRSRKD